MERARAQESIKSAPSSTLQKLQGFTNWLSWYKQQKIVLENIQHDQTKLTIIYQSLYNPEDKKLFKGVTSFEHQMSYLKQKYNRTTELVSNYLGKVLTFKRQGKDIQVMQYNILEMLTIYDTMKS